MLKSSPDIEELNRAVIARWGGHEELVGLGFVPVVRAFFLYVADLKPQGLSPVEAMFVLQLMVHKWDERAPYPSYGRIASRMGVSTVYARKVARSIEEKGLMRRNRLQDRITIEFDLAPLFEKLAQHTRIHTRKEPRSVGTEQGSPKRGT